MTPRPPAPSAVFGLQVNLPPAQLWPQLLQGQLLGPCLGLALPARTLPGAGGQGVDGVDAQGRPVTVQVLALDAPLGLSLLLRGRTLQRRVHLTLEARGQGCRVMLQHEAEAPAGTAVDLPGPDAGRLAPGAGPAVVSASPGAPIDPITTLLAASPAASLLAGRIGSAAALDQARDYLAATADSVRLLLDTMAAGQGYTKPAPDRFSLVEQLWHLADVEDFGWAQRLPRVLHEDRPLLPGVDGDALARERRYQQRPWRAAARRFLARRRCSLAALRRFDAETLARPLQFGGSITDAGGLLAAMLAHDHEHRLEMAALWRTEAIAAALPRLTGDPA